MYTKLFKRFIDIIFSLFVLILASPVMVVTSALLFINNKGSILFLQKRPGHKEKPFTIIKFKTMRDLYGEDGRLLPDDKRLTAIGKLIRKLSLDELPQFINVLKGDMSVIGPRPLLIEYLPLYNEKQKIRHLVKPGITGWAQVNGRNEVSWEDRFELDVWYVENMSFMLDLKIVLLTIIKVYKKEGISSKNIATMEKFKGSNI